MQTNVELGCLPQYEDKALLLKKNDELQAQDLEELSRR